MAPVDNRYFWRDADPFWYKDAIIYEVHVRAFNDSNGDGIGDFAGLTAKLDYLQDLGIDTIWLLPFYPSPLKDDGYDIANYTDIHPSYGTMADFKEFMREANFRGLRVVTEMVLNHTSDQHPWFQRARRAAPGSDHRNFYVWNDNQDKYKGTRIIFKDFELSNWTYDNTAKAYYWHRFYSHQPDLNFESQQVKQSVLKALDFWMGMGVSGMRLDAVPYLYESEGTNCENLPETHALLRELRHHVDTKFRNRMLLSEANQWAEDAVAYFGKGDESHMAFHFPLMPRMFMAIRMEDRFPILDILQNTPQIPEAAQWALFLRNHDELTLEMVTDEERDYMYRVYAHDSQARINLGIRRRLAPLLNNDRRKIELMNSLLFSLAGTPVIYYGDEIGMGDNFYLGDRNGVRTPMQWSADRNAGFSHANPQKLYFPVVTDPEYHYEAINVENQQTNTDSLLWWTKRLISVRKRFKAFSRGKLEFIQPDNRKVLAFVRKYENEVILVVANLSRQAQYCVLDTNEFAGRTPVEMFGQAEFPVIGDSPYPFTLGPYACYWFSLEVKESTVGVQASVPLEKLPVISLTGDIKWLYLRSRRPFMAAAVLDYVKQQRWYGGKSRKAISAHIEDYADFPCGEAHETHLLILRVEYADGEPDNYLVPVAFAMGEETAKVISQAAQSAIARLVIRNRGGEETALIYDALHNESFREMMLRFIDRRDTCSGEKGEITSSQIGDALRKAGLRRREDLKSALIGVEQSNSSIIYEDKFKLKMIRRLEDGVNPELEIGKLLTESETFPNVAFTAGAIEYKTARNKEPVTLAILHNFVKNQGDAWKYTQDSLSLYFEQVLTKRGVNAPHPQSAVLLNAAKEIIPPALSEMAGHYLASAQLMAQRTAELHLAMASEVDDVSFVPEPFTAHYQMSLYHGIRAFVIQTMQMLRRNMKQVPESARHNAQSVLNSEADILSLLQNTVRVKPDGIRIRCHGDYHLGQLLYTGNDFVVVDFEGEPARHLGERKIKRSPLRDVAGMLRSFHYAAQAALKSNLPAGVGSGDYAVLEDWADAWYEWVSAAFLRAYLEMMSGKPVLPAAREGIQAVLEAHVIDKAVYEIAYELNNRPDWVNLPLSAILKMVKTGSHTGNTEKPKATDINQTKK